MGSWSHYIVECEDPEKLLRKMRKNSGSEGFGEILDENRLFFKGHKGYGEYSGSAALQRFQDLSDEIDRVMFVSGDNTGDHVYAELFEVKEGEVNRIDSEASAYWPLTDNEDKNYQGHSYLPAYFYNNYDFKMFDEHKDQEIDYENTYKPQKYLGMDHVCPACKSNKIKIEGWGAKCKECGYSNSKPWFEGYFRFELHAESPEEGKVSTSKLRKLQAKIEKLLFWKN